MLHIDPRIFERFPGVYIGVIVARSVNNAKSHPEIQAELLAEAERVRNELNLETIAQDPRIAAWREIYRGFGSKPSEYRSSIESLCRTVLRGNEVRSVNTLVDLYNLISLRFMLPAGGEDLNKVVGTVQLTLAGSNEPAMVVLGEDAPEQPYEGEVIYKDDIGTICRRWNWREADRTKLTEETTDCILVLEGSPAVGREEVEKASQELAALLQKYCGAETEVIMSL